MLRRDHKTTRGFQNDFWLKGALLGASLFLMSPALVSGIAQAGEGSGAVIAGASKESLMKLFKTLNTDGAGKQVMMNVLHSMAPDLSAAQREKLEKLYRDKVDFSELTERLIPVYQKYFTQADVDQALEFYQSPAGRKFVEKQPMVVMDSQPVIQGWADENRARLFSYVQEGGKKGRQPSSVVKRTGTASNEEAGAGRNQGKYNPIPGVRRF